MRSFILKDGGVTTSLLLIIHSFGASPLLPVFPFLFFRHFCISALNSPVPSDLE